MCSTCIQAPTLRSTKVTQFGVHCSKDLVLRAFSMFWLTCRTTLALYRDVVVVASGAGPGVGELLGTGFGIGEVDAGDAARRRYRPGFRPFGGSGHGRSRPSSGQPSGSPVVVNLS